MRSIRQGIDVYPDTGELTLPMNAVGLGYSEIDLVYTAGLSTISDAVKVACAQIVRNAQATPALNVRSGKLDRMQLDYFSDGLVDQTIVGTRWRHTWRRKWAEHGNGRGSARHNGTRGASSSERDVAVAGRAKK